MPHPSTWCTHIPGRRPPGDPIRHYLVAQRDSEPERYEGRGLTPEAVVAQLALSLGAEEPSPEGDWDHSESPPFDQCVWEGHFVVAVVHARGDRHGSYDATYIDRAGPAPAPFAGPRFDGSRRWTVESSGSVLYQSMRSGETLAAILADLTMGRHTEDVAVWECDRLVAFIRAMPDGRGVASILAAV